MKGFGGFVNEGRRTEQGGDGFCYGLGDWR